MSNDYLRVRELYHGFWNPRLHPRGEDGQFIDANNPKAGQTINSETIKKVVKDIDDEKSALAGAARVMGKDPEQVTKNYKVNEDEFNARVQNEINKKLEEQAKKEAEQDYKRKKEVLGQTSKLSNQIADIIPQKRGKYVHGDYSKISDTEMRETINRLNLESQYANAIGDSKYVKSGEEKTREAMQTIGSVLAITLTALNIAAAVKGINTGNNDGEKKKK